MSFELTSGAHFLHIPKTGGHWVEKALADHGLLAKSRGDRHSTYEQLILNGPGGKTGRENLREALRLGGLKLRHVLGMSPLGQEAPVPFSFCFVRHPLRWYESFWRYNRNRWPCEVTADLSPKNWLITAPLKQFQASDFNEWMWMVANNAPGFVSHMYWCYAGARVSAIGRTENLVDDLKSILVMAGYDPTELKLDPRPVNVSPTGEGDTTVEWDPELLNQVERLELPALAAYGYFTEEQQLQQGLQKPLTCHPALVRTES